jgi:hypothetical protein
MLNIYESVNLPTEVSKPSYDIKTIAKIRWEKFIM